MATELEQILWIRQIKEFGLGNMICMTPGLREMSARLGQRIPMYFETDGLSQLFADCPFIDVMPAKIKHCSAKFTSGKPDRLKGESDYMAWSRILNPITVAYTGPRHTDGKFEPYVDKCSPPDWWKHPKGKTIAIVHGCLSDNLTTIKQKDVGDEVRQHMVDAVCEAGATPVIIGNTVDLIRFWSRIDYVRKVVEFSALGNEDISLHRAVGIMQKCDAFITNATGLYHVGAASGIAGLVLWKGCDFEKNVAPSKHVTHKSDGWMAAISKFVGKVMV